MNRDQLLQIFPHSASTPLGLDNLVNALNDIFAKLGNQTNRSAAFIAQTGYESESFTVFTENLNYSAQALFKLFPSHFSSIDDANLYGRHPEKIANRIYANRMGNGDEASGDGYRFRGRSFIQITGRNNYINCGNYLKIDLINNSELLENLPYVVEGAEWFWNVHDLNQFADTDNITGMTKIINGGLNGINERISLYNKIKLIIN